MMKAALLALGTAASLMAAASAHAGVRWSVGVDLPVPWVGAVVSNGPVYAPGYDAYAPAPTDVPARTYAPVPLYAPAPVYISRLPGYGVGYYPAPVYYRPVPVVYPYDHHRGWHRGWRRDGR